MKKWLRIFKIPTEPKELFVWLVRQALISLGFGWVFGFVALVIVSLTLFGFLVGDYSSNGNGMVNGSGVTLGPKTTAKEKALLTHYEEVADTWQKGLTQDQISQVQQQQVDLPGAVLLGIGKMINNMNPTNAQKYYGYLQPAYTWQTYTDITIRYWTVRVKTKNGYQVEHRSQQTDTPVTELRTANTWDGTLADTYRFVTTMQGNTDNGVYTKKIELANSQRVYQWSRVWKLFKNIPAGPKGQTYLIADSQTDKDILAGLIAAVDYSITDPEVQKMVAVELFPGGTSLGALGPVQAPTGSTLHNVERWKSYIEAAAAKYQVPAVLIAGVMYQESGGIQAYTNGTLLMSSAGAIGLMQVEPSTAAGLTLNGVPIGANAMAELANAETNLEIGAEFLSELYHQFGGNPAEAESAYNAGPGAEQQALAQGNQIAQNSQTLQYVNNIQNSWVPALEKIFGPEGSPVGSTNVGEKVANNGVKDAVSLK